MVNELVKKLTGKNPKEFEFAASSIINSADLKAFSDLVAQSDFLFDFIKKNVSDRLSKACDERNYKNLLEFLSVHSSDYEDFIISTLVKYADEEMTDYMLELLENGDENQKAYAAKYFSHINDSLAIELLRKYSYSEFAPLAMNCAYALSAFKDDAAYKDAIDKLSSDDEFEKLSAVQFLVAYNNIDAVGDIFNAMKQSSMPENIASEISYLKSFLDFVESDFKYDMILAVNHILNGLGEIVSLSQVFDFQLFEVLERLINLQKNVNDSKAATVLLNAKLKFDQLTENDEYLFDEDKNTKNEVFEIKHLLNSLDNDFWNNQKKLFLSELSESSDFIFSALEIVQELRLKEAIPSLEPLLKANQTITLKTVEVLKSLDKLGDFDKIDILKNISDKNIKAIIESNFSI